MEALFIIQLLLSAALLLLIGWPLGRALVRRYNQRNALRRAYRTLPRRSLGGRASVNGSYRLPRIVTNVRR